MKERKEREKLNQMLQEFQKIDEERERKEQMLNYIKENEDKVGFSIEMFKRKKVQGLASESEKKFGFQLISPNVDFPDYLFSENELAEICTDIRAKLSIQEKEKSNKEERAAKERRNKEKKENRRKRWMQLKSLIEFEVSGDIDDSYGGTYVIHCINTDEVYIGSTINFLSRKSHHLNTLRSGNHHSYRLQEAYKKYGEISFRFYVIEILTDLLAQNDLSKQHQTKKNLNNILKTREQNLISQFMPEFNIDQDAWGKQHHQL